MITFLYGTHGSGKTTALLSQIARDTEAGIHTFLIVPEQEAVLAERMTLSMLPASSQLYLEVVSFSRLYNRVCREYGNLSYRYITKPIRHLLMWKNLRELAPLLEEYGNLAASDSSLSELMLNAVGECKACGITPGMLENALRKLDRESPLYRRLRDLSLIYASFDRLVSEEYSDSSDDIARLYDTLKKEDFFRGKHVYIDSFTSFTAMEHRVVEQIFAKAGQVTVTVPLSRPDCMDIDSESIRRSLARLKKSASLFGTPREILLHGNRRATSPALAYLSENLWRLDLAAEPSTAAFDDGSIVMELCSTPYAEAEAAAAHILELLRGGARCRDIAVILRDVSKYRGILEPAFEKNGISFFMSEKTDLCALPPIKLILSALRIKQFNWRKNDVISHIKTGLFDFDLRSADLFEDYIDTWNIQGSRYLGDDWSMNPDGYVETVSERGKEILRAANEVRRQLTGPLEKLFIGLEASETIPDMCRALYAYFLDISLEDKLAHLAVKEAERGAVKQALQMQALYGVILNALADLATALPEEAADTEEFYSILKQLFEKTEIGSIPTSVDEVTVGSASTLRASGIQYAFVLGLCEGEFPAAVQDSGIFSASDRKMLSELEIELSSDSDSRSSDELMFVRRAFSVPSKKLWIFSHTSEIDGKERIPSLPFERVRKIFPALPIHTYSGSDLHYLAGSPKSAVAHLRFLDGTPEGASLRQALVPYLPEAAVKSRAGLSAKKETVSPDATAKMMGDTLHFSFSRFEKYVNCPFSYYCKYILTLRESKKAKIRADSIGSFVHFILENLVKNTVSEMDNGNMPTDEELIRLTALQTGLYLDRICPSEERRSAKLRHFYERLQKLSLLIVRSIVEEFRDSDFRPAFFELKSDGKGQNPAPLVFCADSGTSVSFYGVIDRVDLLSKDGEVYIRVVDYKTGSKTFSLDDIHHGINIQMLLYLFTLCRNQNPEFLHAIGAENGKMPHPAGVVYLSARIPVIEADSYSDEEEILKKAEKELSRSGLLAADEELLHAMSHSLSPELLAGIKKSKSGELTGSALTSHEKFEKIFADMQDVILNIAREMQKGKADASPLTYGSNDPCQYCEVKAVCRKDFHKGGTQ